MFPPNEKTTGNPQAMSARIKLLLLEVFVSGFGSGRSPFAPGTCGSALATMMLWLASFLLPSLRTSSGGLLLALLLTAAAVPAVTAACHSKLFGESKDPKQIVVDEFAGLAWSAVGWAGEPSRLVLAFFLFRLFDIWKPFPVNRLEELREGQGIVLDDVMAGIYAWLTLRLLLLI